MELTVQNVYGLLLRSKLLPLDSAKAMYDRWQKEAGPNAQNLAKFAEWMVSNKFLTQYQANLVARGHADGFFLGRYKILDRLGKGRMAGVYKAQHQLGQIFALKVLPPSKAKDPHLLGRFQREAKLAQKLKHPNIVRAFDTGSASDLHFLVLEYLEGQTLEEHLARRKKLAPAEGVRLVYQALQGLQHIHDRGLVHRDLKPSNLMLVNPAGASLDTTMKATVKILDIGLGRVLFEEGSLEEAMSTGFTGEGMVLGTPDYMSPEQARDARSADIRSDIYSLGCVLFHTLTGQPPYPDTNIISQMIRHAKDPIPTLRQFNPAIPDGLQQILGWMMAKTPDQRYPTPDRAAQALKVFLVAGGDVLPMPEKDPNMQSYMTWLEKNPPDQPPPPPTASAKPTPVQGGPVATAPPPTPGKKSPQPPKRRTILKKERSRSASKKKGRGKGKAPPPIPGGKQEFDVELIALPDGVTPRTSIWQMNKRDLIVFAIGVAAGALVTFLGFLLARG